VSLTARQQAANETALSLGHKPIYIDAPVAPITPINTVNAAMPGQSGDAARSAASVKPLDFFPRIALPLAARGLKVMPIDGKVAFLPQHHLEATTDANKITVDWKGEYVIRKSDASKTVRLEECNVAVHCIQEDGGAVIVDVDGKDIRETYLAETGKPAPDTYVVQSSPGKYHLYFWQTDATRALPKNITEGDTNHEFSLRVKNYYCVGEGSVHPVHGGTYTAISTSPIIPMPDDFLTWLVGRANKHSKTGDFTKKAADWLDEPFIHGDIDNQLIKFVGHFMGAKNINDPDDMYALLTAKLEKNGCFEQDGVTPFAWNDARVREIAATKVRTWKTGDEKNPPVYSGGVLVEKHPKPAATTAAPSLLAGDDLKKAIDASEVARDKARKDYAELAKQVAEIQPNDDLVYPVDIWKGTPYYDFAVEARGEGEWRNHIPMEFFINGLMTYVGAIAGHRIAPESNPNMPAHFYTLLRTKFGGGGKNEVFNWCKKCFDLTGLLYQTGKRNHNNIGVFHSDFASARALIDQYVENPSILQVYGEFTTPIEKFGIQGSGASFLDFNLNMYDSTNPNWSMVKGMRLPENLPKHINNSIIAATTEKRWEQTAGRVNLETFIQRMNLVVVDEIGTIFELKEPDVTEIRKSLLDRIGLLEEYKLLWHFSPEAKALGMKWHEAIQRELQEQLASGEDDDVEVSERVGRLQVFVHRIVGHMALWLGELPKLPDGRYDAPKYVLGSHRDDEMPMIAKYEGHGPDKVWRVEVTAEMIQKAIQAATYLMAAREKIQISEGVDKYALVENLIQKWARRMRKVRWPDLRRRANLNRYGIRAAKDALENLKTAGLLTVNVDPDDKGNQKRWVITWVGDGRRRDQKWVENRGGYKEGRVYL
jgi:hypothetical protein